MTVKKDDFWERNEFEEWVRRMQGNEHMEKIRKSVEKSMHSCSTGVSTSTQTSKRAAEIIDEIRDANRRLSKMRDQVNPKILSALDNGRLNHNPWLDNSGGKHQYKRADWSSREGLNFKGDFFHVDDYQKPPIPDPKPKRKSLTERYKDDKRAGAFG